MKRSFYLTLGVSWFLLIVTLGCTARPKAKVVVKSGAPADARRSSSLGAATLRVLQRLRAPVVINGFVVGGLSGLHDSNHALQQTFAEYAKCSNGNVQFEITETSSLADTIRQRAESAGLYTTTFAESTNGATKVVIGYYGISFQYKGERALVLLTSEVRREELEYQITNVIREVYDAGEKLSRRILHAENYLVGSIVVVKQVLDWMTADAELDDGLH